MESLKSGYMTKCGKTVKSWKKRWFDLKPNGFLYYYTDPSGKTEKGHVDIINCERVAMWDVGEGEKLSDPAMEPRSFIVVCSERTYTCVCDTDLECRSWVETLCKIQNGSEPQHYPPPTYTGNATPPVVEIGRSQTVGAAPPRNPATDQLPLGQTTPPMPQSGHPMPGPPMPQPGAPMPQPPAEQPPPYSYQSNSLPRRPYQPQPPASYRHSYAGDLAPAPQQAYCPPPAMQTRPYVPPPAMQTRPYVPPPMQQPRPYIPPPMSQPRPYIPPGYAPPTRPPTYYQPRPPPAQFVSRPYMPPQRQPQVMQQQQTNTVVINLSSLQPTVIRR